MSEDERTPICNMMLLQCLGRRRRSRSVEPADNPYRVSRPTIRSRMAARLRRQVASASSTSSERRQQEQSHAQVEDQHAVTFDQGAGQNGKPSKSEKPAINCDVCFCGPLEVGGPLLRPCASCSTMYCSGCMANHFANSVKKGDGYHRLPQCQCGGIIPLHAAKPYLSPELKEQYRARFDEWTSACRLYCPVPTCSAFIHDRNLPSEALSETCGKLNDRVTITCPQGHTFCSSCKADHHEEAPCHEPSAEVVLRKALKIWGYKDCPNCGTGVKRMLGCNHIMCPCGAHWCWHCLRDISVCRELEDCADDDAADASSFTSQDAIEAVNQAEQRAAGGGEPSEEESELALRAANIDRQDMDNENLSLNSEPDEPMMGQFGGCAHSFVVYNPTSKLGTAGYDSAEEMDKYERLVTPEGMECHRCWKPVFDVRYFQDRQQTPDRDVGAASVEGSSTVSTSATDTSTKDSKLVTEIPAKESELVTDLLVGEKTEPAEKLPEGAAAVTDGLAYACRERRCGLLVCFACQHLLQSRLEAIKEARREYVERELATGRFVL